MGRDSFRWLHVSIRRRIIGVAVDRVACVDPRRQMMSVGQLTENDHACWTPASQGACVLSAHDAVSRRLPSDEDAQSRRKAS